MEAAADGEEDPLESGSGDDDGYGEDGTGRARYLSARRGVRRHHARGEALKVFVANLDQAV